MRHEGTPPVEILRRWVDAGGVVRVAAENDGLVTVSMLTCSAGEEVDRLTSDDPAVAAFLRERDR